MATVYFGAQQSASGSSPNGNWRDITQWYSNPGNSGEGGYNGTLLNRFPNPATDTVISSQNILSNVGTYVGTYPNGSWAAGTTYSGKVVGNYCSFLDANAIWTGTIGDSTYYQPNIIYAGTFNCNLAGLVWLYGGNFENSNFTNVTGLEILEYNNSYPPTPFPMTLPTTYNLPNLNSFWLDRPMTWSIPLVLQGTNPRITIRAGSYSRQFPTITVDISTAATNCTQFDFRLGNYDGVNYQNIGLTDLNTILTNPAPLIFGSPTKPARFSFQFVAPNREITVYVSNTTSNSEISNGTGTFSAAVYDKLNIIEANGSTGANINIYSPVTWKPTISLPIAPTTLDPKYKVATLPQRYTFGIAGGSKYEPIINLNLTKNVAAVLE
jgi:hypothetical protein